MRTYNREHLDEKNEEIVDILISLGMSRTVARTLSYLRNMHEATSMDLERRAGLRQPEVSIAMRELKRHSWINERKEKKIGKGRHYKIYSLKVGFNEIIAQFEEQSKKAVEDMQERIERLKELG